MNEVWFISVFSVALKWVWTLKAYAIKV
jgi:hypothetical protein